MGTQSNSSSSLRMIKCLVLLAVAMFGMHIVDTMEDMVDTATEDMVDMGATEDMVDTTVASGLPMQSPLQLLKLMPTLTPMLIATDMVVTMEAMVDTMEDMVGMATEDMVDTTVASGLLKQSPLQLLKLMPMLIASDMDTATEAMVDTMEDMVDTAMEDMVDTTVASDLLKQSPLQLLKLMPTPMRIASDMVDTMEDMEDTTEDMVDTGATEDMVDTTVASVLLMLNLLLMLMPIAMVATVATEVMADTMVDTVDMVMVDMATGDKQINTISS